MSTPTGWVTLAEAHSKFRSLDPFTWSAEFMCERASTKGLICSSFTLMTHGLTRFEPDPAIGPTFMCVDFGGTNPTATIYGTFIALREGIECVGHEGNVQRVPYGSYVFHSEHYKAEQAARAKVYTDRIKAIEERWRSRFPEFRVWGRFYDAQGKGMRGEWADHGIDLRNYTGKDAQRQAQRVSELCDDGLFWVDDSAPMLAREIESWSWDERRGVPLKREGVPDHSIDAAKYLVANVRASYSPARDFGKPAERVADAPRPAASRPVYRASGVGSPYVSRRPFSAEHVDGALEADYAAAYGAFMVDPREGR